MSNKRITRRTVLSLAGVAAGGAVLGRGRLMVPARAAEEAGKEFKIGAVLELSGADASGGHLAQRGYEFWVDTVNKAGGIEVGGKKYPVRMISQDSRSQPAAGAQAASRLINEEKVDAIFGSYTSGVQLAINPICAKYKVPCIAGSAESPGNWTPQPQFTFGIIPSVDLTADKALKFIVETGTPKPTSAAIIGANEPFSKDAAAGFAAGAKEAGLRITTNTLFPPTADLSPVISAVIADKPDIIAVGGHDTILINVVKTLKAQNYMPKALIQHYGVTEPAFVEALGKDADGVLGIIDWDPGFPYKDDVFGTAQEFADNYKAKYKVDADYTGAGCAVSGEVLQLALKQLGKGPGLSEDDRAQLAKIIGETDIHTFYGPIKFDQSGAHFHDNTLPPPMLAQIQGGKVVSVAPKDVSRAKLIYPLGA
ncbi:MAG: amino acid ABC transporter substrate-binding protein [Hyphomicrobiales bacterium]|nr:amino acid ABC transporter substrate-binding protein [Hyphomicrobiales bacterium]